MAAILPVGDLALQASGFTGRPPHTLLNLLAGYSQISSALPDEMRAAVDAINASSEATASVRGTGDADQRLAQLRSSIPAVDDYVGSVDARLIEGFDIINPTLREQPQMILRKLANGLDADPDEARATADALAAVVRSEVPEQHRTAFDELLIEARNNFRLGDERGSGPVIGGVLTQALGRPRFGRHVGANRQSGLCRGVRRSGPVDVGPVRPAAADADHPRCPWLGIGPDRPRSVGAHDRHDPDEPDRRAARRDERCSGQNRRRQHSPDRHGVRSSPG